MSRYSYAAHAATLCEAVLHRMDPTRRGLDGEAQAGPGDASGWVSNLSGSEDVRAKQMLSVVAPQLMVPRPAHRNAAGSQQTSLHQAAKHSQDRMTQAE